MLSDTSAPAVPISTEGRALFRLSARCADSWRAPGVRRTTTVGPRPETYLKGRPFCAGGRRCWATLCRGFTRQVRGLPRTIGPAHRLARRRRARFDPADRLPLDALVHALPHSAHPIDA